MYEYFDICSHSFYRRLSHLGGSQAWRFFKFCVLAATGVLQATVSGPVGPSWAAEKNSPRDPMTALGSPPTPVLETGADIVLMVHLQSYAVVPAPCKSSASSAGIVCKRRRLCLDPAMVRAPQWCLLGQAAAQWHGGQTGGLCVLVSILEARYSSTSQTSRDDHVVTSHSSTSQVHRPRGTITFKTACCGSFVLCDSVSFCATASCGSFVLCDSVSRNQARDELALSCLSSLP
jgi:hypothetical protein